MRLILTLFLLMVPFSVRAAEEETPLPAPFDTMKQVTIAGDVVVPAADTLVLKDTSKIVKLMGIDIPDAGQNPPGPFAVMAQGRIAEILETREVGLYQAAKQKTAEAPGGAMLAFALAGDDDIFLQEDLVAKGWARVWDGYDTGVDLTRLFRAEDSARAAGLGIWANDSSYRMRAAADISPSSSGLMVVTGKVSGLISFNNMIYVALTDKGKRGFTVRIAADQRANFQEAGLDAFAWSGKLLRVRGEVKTDTEDGTPFIQASQPWQMEVLSGDLMGDLKKP